jgi:hypothetical protein
VHDAGGGYGKGGGGEENRYVAIGVAAWQRVLKRQGEEGKASYIEGGSADGRAVQSTAHAASTVSWQRGRAVRAVPRRVSVMRAVVRVV